MSAPAGFRPTSARTWTLGDPDSPDLAFNGIDADGVEWIVGDPVGWYASPPVNLGLEDRPGDGAFFGRGAYSARVLEVTGAFRVCGRAPAGAGSWADALDAAAERLQDCLDPSRDTLFAVTEAIPKQLTVRPSAEVVALPVPGHRRVRTFSFVLTAADPYKYAAGAAGLISTELRLLDPAGVPGMTHDLTHPLDHGGADIGPGRGRATVTNPGQLHARPVLRITGPCPAPTLTNASTGEAFTLARDLTAGEEVVIDTELRTVLVSGASDSRLKAPRSTFWALARGPNDLRFTAAAYSPDARATVSFRPRWK